MLDGTDGELKRLPAGYGVEFMPGSVENVTKDTGRQRITDMAANVEAIWQAPSRQAPGLEGPGSPL